MFLIREFSEDCLAAMQATRSKSGASKCIPAYAGMTNLANLLTQAQSPAVMERNGRLPHRQ
jgi:hypothetical protein